MIDPHLDRCNYRVSSGTVPCNCRDLIAMLECAEPQDGEKPGAEQMPRYAPRWAAPLDRP